MLVWFVAGDVVQTEAKTTKLWEATKEGAEVVSNGSPEGRLFAAVDPDQGTSQEQLAKAVGAATAKVGLGKAMANGWVATSKEGKVAIIKRKVDTIEDKVRHIRMKSEGQHLQIQSISIPFFPTRSRPTW